jgi:hypothetical protein
MDRLEAISVDLTTEEMAVLLAQLGLEEYAGLDSSGLDDLSARERELVLDVARRGLIARRILIKDESGEWQLGQYALAAVGVSLSPARSVMVVQGRSRNSASSYLFHTAQDVFVTHEVAENGLHQFLVLRDGETWGKAILSAAGLPQDGGGEEPVDTVSATVQPSLLNETYEQAQSGLQNEAEATLIEQGVERGTAESLVSTLSGPVTFATVVAIRHTAEEQRDDMTILSGATDCWALDMSQERREEAQFNVTRLSLEEARLRVNDLIV